MVYLKKLKFRHFKIKKESQTLNKTLPIYSKYNNNYINYPLAFNYDGYYGYKNITEFTNILQTISENINIRGIYLNYNNFNTEYFKIIYKILKHNTTITHIYLCKNNLSTSFSYLSKLLITNTSITLLDLGKTSINDEGVKLICQALNYNNTLIALFMNNNDITDKGVEHICQLLKINKTIQKLILSCNKITNKGANNINNVLKLNGTIEYYIFDSDVSDICERNRYRECLIYSL
jgi:hypothetical protein